MKRMTKTFQSLLTITLVIGLGLMGAITAAGRSDNSIESLTQARRVVEVKLSRSNDIKANLKIWYEYISAIDTLLADRNLSPIEAFQLELHHYYADTINPSEFSQAHCADYALLIYQGATGVSQQDIEISDAALFTLRSLEVICGVTPMAYTDLERFLASYQR